MAPFCLQDHTVDLEHRVVRSNSGQFALSENEVALLAALHGAGGEPVERSALRAALGIHPRSQSRALHHAITRLRKKLGADSIQTVRGRGYSLQATTPAPAPAPAPVNEPPGRAALFQALEQHAGAPLVTLCGPGGIGKSWAARSWRGAQGCVVDLSAAETERDLLWLVGQALGAPPRAQDIDDARAEVVRIAHSFPKTPLILDNVEPVLAPARRLVQAMVRQGGISIIATSRVALGLPGERTLPVEPLDADASRALFEQAGGRCEDEEDRAALLALLDGVPLAIQFAAARTQVLSVPELIRRLQRQPSILRRSPSRSQDDRHQTMAGAFEVSWALLSAREQEALAALTVFSGAFSLDAAEAVLGAEALDLLEALIQQSMVQTTPSASGLRYRLFTVTRAFAAARQPAPERKAAQARHLAWCARRCAGLIADIDGPEGDHSLEQIREEYSELQAAFRRGAAIDVAQTAIICEALQYLAILNATVLDPGALEAAVAAAGGTPAVEARLRVVQSAVRFRARRTREAITASSQALSLLEGAPGAAALRAEALLSRSSPKAILGDADGASEDARAALAVAEAAGLESLQVSALVTIATQATRQGRYNDSEAALLRASALSRGRLYPRASVLLALSVLYTRQKRLAEAMTCAQGARARLIRLKDSWNIAIVTRTIASIALAAGDLDDAERAYQDALRASQATGNPMSAGFCLSGLALCEIHRGRLSLAEQHASEALMIHRLSEHRVPELATVQLLALLSACRGALERAGGYLERAEQLLAARTGGPWRGRQDATRALVAVLRGEAAPPPEASPLDPRAQDILALAEAARTHAAPALREPLVRALAQHLPPGPIRQ